MMLEMVYVYISLVLAAWGIFGVLLLMLIQQGKNTCESERKKYQTCKTALDETQGMVRQLRAEYNKRLKEYTQYNKLALSVYEALKNGSVKLVCPKHKTDVQILTDGTIICGKGHRLWPPEDTGEGGGDETGELQSGEA